MTFDEYRCVFFEILQKLNIMSGQGEQGEGETQEDMEVMEVDEQTQGITQPPVRTSSEVLEKLLTCFIGL